MILLLLAACGPTAEESPKTLEEMTQLAVRDFSGPDGLGRVEDLAAWMLDNQDVEVDGYYFDALPEEVVADIEHSDDIVWEECLGAGVLYTVSGTVEDYARAATEGDQSFADSSYSIWDRRIIEGSADGFLAGDDMKADDTVEKTEVGITIPYGMYKEFRWFDGGLAALSWVPEAGYNEAGDNGIVGGFTVEVWMDQDDGVLWYNGQWSDLKTLLDDYMREHPETALDLLISGTLDYMQGTEAHVTGG